MKNKTTQTAAAKLVASLGKPTETICFNLSPQLRLLAERRAKELGISFSGFVSLLLERKWAEHQVEQITAALQP